MCINDPDAAVMVTVEVPTGVGFGLVTPPFDPPHALRERATSNSGMAPPPRTMALRDLFRFRSAGSRARKPKGTNAPAASDSTPGPRRRPDTSYGFGGGAVYVPVVILRVVFAVAPAVGVTDVGENWNVAPVGRPETVKFTGKANPFAGRTLTCTVADPPCLTVTAVWARLTVKSPVPGGAAAVIAPNKPPLSWLSPAAK